MVDSFLLLLAFLAGMPAGFAIALAIGCEVRRKEAQQRSRTVRVLGMP